MEKLPPLMASGLDNLFRLQPLQHSLTLANLRPASDVAELVIGQRAEFQQLDGGVVARQFATPKGLNLWRLAAALVYAAIALCKS